MTFQFHFYEFPDETKIILFISSFMALFNRKKIFPYLTKNVLILFELFSKNWKNFFSEFKNKWEIKRFISFMGKDIHPFFLARRNLAESFINNLSPKNRSKFINFYLSLPEKDREIIDIFVRNYVRYNRKWEFDIPLISNGLNNFIETYKLPKIPSYLSFFSFDKKERKKFQKIIIRMNKISNFC